MDHHRFCMTYFTHVFLLISITLSFWENRFFLFINSSFSKAMRKYSQKQINSSFSFSIFIDNQLMKTNQILTWLFGSFVVWFERRKCHYLWSSVRILVLGRVDADLFPYLMEPCIYFLKEHQAKRRTFLVCLSICKNISSTFPNWSHCPLAKFEWLFNRYARTTDSLIKEIQHKTNMSCNRRDSTL